METQREVSSLQQLIIIDLGLECKVDANIPSCRSQNFLRASASLEHPADCCFKLAGRAAEFLSSSEKQNPGNTARFGAFGR